jgi:NAD(P)-dependent dehydrogenase (short-subunit alcohol dehydrogenase family)
MDLTGRKVLVTGANRGVGAAFVSAAREPGCTATAGQARAFYC